tara:strand:- start:53 stop:199 length:147 start_codon:yes stop_codon:yes gene_type:complete
MTQAQQKRRLKKIRRRKKAARENNVKRAGKKWLGGKDRYIDDEGNVLF